MPLYDQDGRLPAFPGTRENGLTPPTAGMDLRTYIATQALAGLLASNLFTLSPQKDLIDSTAGVAVKAADALLKALARG